MVELRRCVELLDGECTLKDGSNADTFTAHNLLGDFDGEAYHSMMNGPRIRQAMGLDKPKTPKSAIDQMVNWTDPEPDANMSDGNPADYGD